MTAYERAEKYLAKCPPAISRAAGHNQTFSVACALVNGFALDEHEAWPLLEAYNLTCQPPWSEKDLRHKLESAMSARHDKPRGYMLGKNAPGRAAAPRGYSNPHRNGKAAPAPKGVKPAYDLAGAQELPEPVEDGARALLRACFEPGEGVRIVNARIDDDGGEVPDGNGPCLSREEWLRRLDGYQGNPNGIWSSRKRTGIYVAINPLKLGGSRDSDVTAFRHALVEFDDGISPEEQLRLYHQSGLPCAAVIYSGGKSVHAWVKIGAGDRREYDDRVKALYEHFESAGYALDTKNKNPSRLSRLPNCVRFNRRQELLALNIGCESFSEWLAEKQVESIGTVRTVDDLLNFEPDKDENTVLGGRWLCRGGSVLLIGPSGVGKSSLMVQAFACWAVGRPFAGIAPKRPLKILVIQAENDDGDLAEMLQGVLYGMDLLTDEEDALLRKNLVFVRDTTHTGMEFTQAARRLIDKFGPDMVGLDPLLSFIGADISRQEVCSEFLRTWLNPIADATGVVWFFTHHTGKPSTDPKSKKHWKSADYGYSGMGSSELTNWARAIIVLEQAGDGAFRLRLPKRGNRAGATHPDGSPTNVLWLRHSDTGIYWKQVDPPEETKDEHRGGKPSKVDAINSMNLAGFLAACSAEGEGKNEVSKRLEAWLATKNEDVSLPTCKRAVERLVKSRKLKKTGELYVKGENA